MNEKAIKLPHRNGQDALVRVSITLDGEGRYRVEVAQRANSSEHALFGAVRGSGETEQEAVKEFIRRCVKRDHDYAEGRV